jgi:hypothetical protein
MIEHFFDFLKNHGLVEIAENWTANSVFHGADYQSYYKISGFRKLTREIMNIPSYSGLYAYNLRGEWLYIGTGRNVFKRIKMHLQESCRAAGGETWQNFFSQEKYLGEITVYTKEVGLASVEDDNIRIAIEAILQRYHTTLWDSFLANRRKEKQIAPSDEETHEKHYQSKR